MAATNEFYKDFSNRKPFNNIPCREGEILAPVVVAGGMKITLKDAGLIWDNVETWHFPWSGKPVPVAFIQIEEGAKAYMEKEFNSQVHLFLNGDKNLFEADELESIDEMLDSAQDDDKKGYDPTGTTENEDKAFLGMVFSMLIDDLNELDENFGRIIQLLSDGYKKGEILEMVDLGTEKTQGYAFIKKAQKTAKEIYDKKYRG